MVRSVQSQEDETVANLQNEIVRLNKVIQALMNRAECDQSLRSSDFNLFERTITLESQVQIRTKELEDAMRENHKITRALRESENKIRHLAFYDPLTELGNRRLLHSRLSLAMAESKRSGCYGAVIFLDLDNFKPLNDTHGHDVGDLLLIEVAHRLTQCVREVDTVARIGGDEFVLIICNLGKDKAQSMAHAALVVEKVRSSLTKTYQLVHTRKSDSLKRIKHHCTASIGVAMFLEKQSNQDEILKCADQSMYQAKQIGHNKVVFYEDKHQKENEITGLSI